MVRIEFPEWSPEALNGPAAIVGEILADELAEMRLSAKKLADTIEVPQVFWHVGRFLARGQSGEAIRRIPKRAETVAPTRPV